MNEIGDDLWGQSLLWREEINEDMPKHTEGGDKEELGKSFFFKVDNGSICLSLCVFRLTLMLFCLFILVDVLIFVLWLEIYILHILVSDEKNNGQKMFIQAVVDLNLALGQLLKVE